VKATRSVKEARASVLERYAELRMIQDGLLAGKTSSEVFTSD
jgi:hypothetical protein